MKIQPINKFWTKLMVSSESINKIPYEYLSYSQNLRIYDGGIWARKGIKRIFNGQGLNQWGFSLNGSLYQVEGGKIWKLENETRTEIVSIGHTQKVDVLVYQNTKGVFTSMGTENFTYSSAYDAIARFKYKADNKELQALDFHDDIGAIKIFTNDNRIHPLPAIKILNGGTPLFTSRITTWFRDATGVILTNGQYVQPDSYILTGNFNIEVGYYTTNEKALITSNGKDVTVFDGVNVNTVSIQNTGIIEFNAGRSWLSAYNVLYASMPITIVAPQNAYDFTGTGSYSILYDSEIKGLKSTLGGLYVFTRKKVEYISAENSAIWLSLPVWEGWDPINNLCIVSAGSKIFYITRLLDIETINYVPWINDAQVWSLSSQKLVNIKKTLNNLDSEQPTAYAYNDKKDNTIHFFLRTIGSIFNDICIVYDLVNDTWNIDIGRYYWYVTEYNGAYYGFSDLNASVFEDNIWYTDDGAAIYTKWVTQSMNFNSHYQKLFTGFYTAWAISQDTELGFKAYIDEAEVFYDTIQGNATLSIGGIGSLPVWGGTVWWESFADYKKPFTIEANEGRIWQFWDRFAIEFSCETNIQDWILDTLGIRLEIVSNVLTENVF